MSLPNSFGQSSICLTLRNDSTTPARQPAIIIRGQGAHWSGRGTAPVGGSTIIFTEPNTYGLIQTSGLGLLRLQDITLRNMEASVNTPFIYTTNTTLHIEHCSFVGAKSGASCDQDAIILGGPNQIDTHG